MRLRVYTVFAVILTLAAASVGQTRFRSGIFLHHSTGACIWGPNGAQVSVPAEIAKYNSSHHLLESDSLKMIETWWPSDDNEWATWHNIFDNRDAANDIRPFLASYPVIMIKSCFPSANMSGVGSSADSLYPTIKSTANYKWHWRSLISVMKGRPQNFFIIWTNAPQVAGSTNASEAALSNSFCRWAKDTLAAGFDPIVGVFPKNVFVFDFFHLLAGTDGMLPLQLASGSSDSHPNAAATTLATPQLVKQVCDAALAYENRTEAVEPGTTVPITAQLEQNYPNPFNPRTTIGFRVSGVTESGVSGEKTGSGSTSIDNSRLTIDNRSGSGVWGLGSSWVRLSVFDLLGREVALLVNEKKEPGNYTVTFDGRGLGSGVYFYRVVTGSFTETKRLVLLR